MIGRDFGVVGTLDPTGGGPEVVLRLKGNDLGPMNKWVKAGDVFAVVQVRSERRRQPAPAKGAAKSLTVQAGTRVDGTLLRVAQEPRDGLVRCKMFYRYEDPLPVRGVIGYRCIKLGTTEAPLRLQLTDPNGVPHKGAALQVYARADDFPDGTREAELTDGRDGLFISKEPFNNVAFVRVMLGSRRLSRIPVEILDERVEVRSIRLDPNAEQRDRLEADRRALLSRITDGRLIQVRIFQEITAFEQAGKKQQALDRGNEAVKSLDVLAKDLEDDIARFRERAKDVPKADALADDADKQLQALRAKQDELRGHVEALKVAIVEDMDPAVQEKKRRVQDIVRKAELLVSQAEYDEALKTYEAALAEVQNEPAAKQRIEMAYNALKNAWAIKEGDAAHADARKFIYFVWARLGTLQDVRDQLPNARRAFEKCKSVGDRMSINKMQLASVEVAAKFGDELKKLIDSAMEEEERKTLEMYQKVNEDLQKLLKEMQDYLLAGQKK
jgi:tetratricopeptide (TPR) repeat protein